MVACIGWDIGGAHLKAVHLNADGKVVACTQHPCPLWRGIGELTTAFPQACAEIALSAELPACHAVTMTAEMVDCFDNRSHGVIEILDAINGLVRQSLQIYAVSHGLVNSAAARRMPTAVASSNWHATAAYAATHLDQGIVVDIGSTTTDIVPVSGGRVLETPDVRRWNDRARLMSGTLVYTGVVRTPIMAVASVAEIDGQQFPIVAEHFANAADMYRLLGKLPEHADQYPSCDGRDKSVASSAMRFARMFGDDFCEDEGIWFRLAQHVAAQQQSEIMRACLHLRDKHLLSRVILVGAGAGSFLAQEIAVAASVPYVDFAVLCGEENADATYHAAAFALARTLYREHSAASVVRV